LFQVSGCKDKETFEFRCVTCITFSYFLIDIVNRQQKVY